MLESIEQSLQNLGPFLLNVLLALAVLIIGYIVAKIIAGLVRKAFRRTGLDERIAQSMSDDPKAAVRTEEYIGKGVFYVLMLFVLIAFFQVLDLETVSQPLDRFLTRVMEFIPQLLAAAVLVLVAYIVATVLRMLTRKALRAADVDERFDRQLRDEPTVTTRPPDATPAAAAPATSRTPVSETIATAVYYLVFLLFLPAILGTLELEGLLRPVEGMVNEALNFLPNLLAAVLIGVIGYFIAKLIRRIVASLAAAAGADALAQRVGLNSVLGQQRLSDVLGTIVYVLVLIPVAIAALNALDIEAVTAPASRMLDLVLAAIPKIFAAAIVLIIAYVVGRLLAGLVSNLLSSIGFNRMLSQMGLTREVAEGAARPDRRTPADVIGSLVLVGVMLFAAMEAANLLGFEALTVLIAEFLVFAGQILIGLVIFALGLYLANIAYRAIRDADINQAEILAVTARLAIIILAGAMALRQMGLANSIINLAFGLILGAIAVAAAIAFGIGGRDKAREYLERWTSGGGSTPGALKPSADAPGMRRGPEKRIDPGAADAGRAGSTGSAPRPTPPPSEDDEPTP